MLLNELFIKEINSKKYNLFADILGVFSFAYVYKYIKRKGGLYYNGRRERKCLSDSLSQWCIFHVHVDWRGCGLLTAEKQNHWRSLWIEGSKDKGIESRAVTGSLFEKRSVPDVVLEDKSDQFYDLEMQVSGYMKEEQLRFQQYGYRLVGRQLKKGDDYTMLKPFIGLSFWITSQTKHNTWFVHVKDEDNREEPNGTLHCIVWLCFYWSNSELRMFGVWKTWQGLKLTAMFRIWNFLFLHIIRMMLY